MSNAFVLALCAGVLVLFFKLISPFGGALVAAVTLAIVFYPLYRKLGRWLPGVSASFRSLAACVAVAMFFIVPLTGMTWVAVEQSSRWAPVIREWQGRMDQWREGEGLDARGSRRVQRWLGSAFGPISSSIHQRLPALLSSFADRALAFEGKLAGALLPSVGSTGVMLFALFFFFRDGEGMYQRFQDHLPLEEERKRSCTDRLRLAVTGVLRGWLLCAVLQGVVAGVGYVLVGVKGWVLLGTLTILAGLLPVIGTALVWCPIAVFLLLQGSVGSAVFIGLWGAGVVGLIDNVLRPYLIGQETDVSILFLFLSILGGVNLWGMKGIILGPVIVSVAPVLFDAYRERFLRERDVSVPVPRELTPASAAR